jgi:DNA-binding NarL/FixJ family response regulator
MGQARKMTANMVAIAPARLYITPGTAKTHVAHLLIKLGARDRIQLVILAYRTGLITAR